jgi:hypothetical protein
MVNTSSIEIIVWCHENRRLSLNYFLSLSGKGRSLRNLKELSMNFSLSLRVWNNFPNSLCLMAESNFWWLSLKIGV